MTTPTKPWKKLHSSFLDCAKLMSLPSDQFSDWVCFLAIADDDGKLPGAEQIAFRTRRPLERIEKSTRMFGERRLIDFDSDGIAYIHDFDDWQGNNSRRRSQKNRATRLSKGLSPRVDREKWRAEILKRDREACSYCLDVKTFLQISYFTPIAKGGHEVVSNMGMSCQRCAHKKLDSLPGIDGRVHIKLRSAKRAYTEYLATS